MMESDAEQFSWTLPMNKQGKNSVLHLQILTQLHVNGSFSMRFYNLFFKYCNFNRNNFKGKLDVPCQAATFQYPWQHALTKTIKKCLHIIYHYYVIYIIILNMFCNDLEPYLPKIHLCQLQTRISSSVCAYVYISKNNENTFIL